MDIATRVENAFDHASKMKWDEALDAICPAVEATARKGLQKNKITGKEYKDFLRSYYPILERFSCTGLNMDETKFPNVVVETDDNKRIENPDVADIVYHCYRNAVAHGYAISAKFAFSQPAPVSDSTGWNFDMGAGRIHFPTNLIWALIAVVVFCKANADIKSLSGSWLSLRVDGHDVKFTTGLFWGGEDLVLNFFEKYPVPRIVLDFDRWPKV